MNDKLMAGIDLHSNNLFCGIVTMDGKRVFEKRLPCDMTTVLKALLPFKDCLETVAVESTYNWYWLVDGLQDAGYRVVLANPAAMDQYSGLKHGDDQSDAFFIAELLRLKILPTGYICERSLRPIRDLLRRRLLLVQKRTSVILSLKSLYARMHGRDLPLKQIKITPASEASALFTDPLDQLVAQCELQLIEQCGQAIEQMEERVLERVKCLPCYRVLQSIPGVGKILALTITLETAEINRFATAGDYASYCRCVDATRSSNDKKKGVNNRKCGNKYLSWAYVEAANFAKRYDEQCRQYFDRKAAKTNTILATKALACKLAKAAWHMMSEKTVYDPRRVFPSRTQASVVGGKGEKTRKSAEPRGLGTAGENPDGGVALSP